MSDSGSEVRAARFSLRMPVGQYLPLTILAYHWPMQSDKPKRVVGYAFNRCVPVMGREDSWFACILLREICGYMLM